MNAFIEPFHFTLKDVFTFGVTFNKFGDGYSLPIKLPDDTKNHIELLVTSHETKSPIYGDNILYLKFAAISVKQRSELLNCGKCNVHVNFDVTGIYTAKTGVKYLTTKVTGLGKSENQKEEEPPQDLEYNHLLMV